MEEAEELAKSIEQTIGGKVRLKGGRFHVRYVATGFGEIEAHLLAEGFRKLASIAYLIVNGSLTKDSILFWDEPEANLNPKLVTEVAKILRSLAAGGVQIFIASHDYLLTNELAMAANYELAPRVPINFFGFKRTEDRSAVEVESSDRLADLQDNPILQEFAEHYDREQKLLFPPSLVGGHHG
jgi:wobble nucleotide-excising tRNase